MNHKILIHNSKIDGKQIFHLYNPWIIDAKRIFVAKGEENAYGEDNKRYVKVDEEWEGKISDNNELH